LLQGNEMCEWYLYQSLNDNEEHISYLNVSKSNISKIQHAQLGYLYTNRKVYMAFLFS